MVDIKGLKTQNPTLLNEVKQHKYKLKHVKENEIKQPKVEGLGHVVDKKGSCCSKK